MLNKIQTSQQAGAPTRIWRRLTFVGVLIGLISLYIWGTSRLDAEDIRTEIKQALAEDAAFDVAVGDIGWGWLSGFGITLQDVVVQATESQEVLARIESVFLDVALVPLLVGAPKITLNKIEINGVRMKFAALAEGGYEWEKGEEGEVKLRGLFEALVPVPSGSSWSVRNQSRVIFNPDVAHISDVVIEYTSQAQHYRLGFDEIALSGLQSEAKEAQMRLVGNLETINNKSVQFDFEGRAFVPLRGFSAGRLEALDAGVSRRILDIEHASAKSHEEGHLGVIDFFTPLHIPWRMQVERGELSFEDGTTYATELEVKWFDEMIELNGDLIGDLLVTLTDVAVDAPFNDINWEGNLHIRTNDKSRLREAFGAPPPAALEAFALEGNFHSVPDGLYSDQAEVMLNNEVFVGELLVVFEELVKFRLNASGRQLSLDPWLRYAPPARDLNPITSVIKAVLNDDEPLWSQQQQQVASRYRWEILLRLERMTYAGLTFFEVDFLSQFDGKHINAEMSSDQTLKGSLNMRVAVDLEPPTPIWQMRFDTERTDLTEFNQWLKLRLGIAGFANLNGYATMSGIGKNELLNSLTGALRVRGETGWVDIAAIKRLALQYAVVTAEQPVVSEWPAQFQFSHLDAMLSVPNGYDNQRFVAQVDGLAVSATGQIDPFQELMRLDVDFRFEEDLFTSSLNSRSGFFRNVSWPVTCRGNYTNTLPCRLVEGANDKLITKLLASKERRLASLINWSPPFQISVQSDAGSPPPNLAPDAHTIEANN